MSVWYNLIRQHKADFAKKKCEMAHIEKIVHIYRENRDLCQSSKKFVLIERIERKLRFMTKH